MNLREVSSKRTVAIRSDVDPFADWLEPCCSGTRARSEHSDDRTQWEDATQACA
jgi:hypothetical protein